MPWKTRISYLRICQEEVNTKRALRNLSLSFHFYFRYIARFCREKKAIVFTGDSVFFVFELKGIVLIDGITILDYRNYHPFVDINGKKGPNKWGYDLFRFVRRGSSKKGIFIDTDVGQTVDKGGKTAAEMYEQSFLH